MALTTALISVARSFPSFEFEEAVNRSDVVVRSQLSICFVESNGAFDVPARIQNTNLTGAKARAGLRIISGGDWDLSASEKAAHFVVGLRSVCFLEVRFYDRDSS